MYKWIGVLTGITVYRRLKRFFLRHYYERGLIMAREQIVTLNDRRYHINIRAKRLDLPVLLFLHGGPGQPLSPTLHRWQAPLEEHFICVHWDQFASGKSFGLNLSKPPITFHQTLLDAEALIEWLCRRFHKERIILCGFSWGSILGLQLAKYRPKHLSAYVGIGQSLNEEEESIWQLEKAAEFAEQVGSLDEAASFRLTAEHIADAVKESVGDRFSYLRAQHWLHRNWSARLIEEWRLFLNSPYYGIWNIRHLLSDQVFHQRHLYDTMLTFDAYRLGKNFEIPLVFISGEDDNITPVSLVHRYVSKISAPYVHVTTIPKGVHQLFIHDAEATTNAMIHNLTRALHRAINI